MTSFQAKIVWNRQRKRENKNYSFVPSLPVAKFKKLNNTVMALFRAEIGRRRLRTGENKY